MLVELRSFHTQVQGSADEETRNILVKVVGHVTSTLKTGLVTFRGAGILYSLRKKIDSVTKTPTTVFKTYK